jgi:hypothetical protein
MRTAFKTLLLVTGLATAAGAATAASAYSAPVLSGAVYRPGDQPVLEKAQYMWGGRGYCWYLDGWHGPGYYWCGYAWRHGRGWGGGEGWNGWRWQHGGYYHREWHDDWHGDWHDRGGWHGGHGDWHHH